MRTARVLQVALHNPTEAGDPDERIGINLENVLALLERAERFDPDLVCFPETCLTHAARHDFDLMEVAQPVPGPATDAVGERARALDSYVLVPTYERDGGAVYNAVALVGPGGEVEGVYRKVAPSAGELDAGVAPGEEVPVWETRFGRVGASICWDVRYPEVGLELGRGGADLVVHPTLGSGDRQFRTWALYHGYHVAFCHKREARVYTPRGTVIAEVEDEWKNPRVTDLDLHGGSARLSFAPLNLDCRSYSRGTLDRDAGERLQREFGGSVVIHAANDDGVLVVESVDEDLPLDEVEEAVGLERTRTFEERLRATVRERTGDSPL